MRTRTKVMLVGVALTFAVAFLFAPLLYVGNFSPMVGGNLPIFQSLGCATIGYGAVYGPVDYGFHFDCSFPDYL